MSLEDPQPGEPGYWNKMLGAAKTDSEFFTAYVNHKKEIEKLGPGSVLTPYHVLCTRLLARFGQYKWGDGEDDPTREDAIFVLREVQRYFMVATSGNHGINASWAIRNRTLLEAEADIACAVSSLLGFERSRAEFAEANPADSASPSARKVAATIDLSRVDEEERARIQEQVAKAIDATHRERDRLEGRVRNRGMVMVMPGETVEDAEQRGKDSHKWADDAQRELDRQAQEREDAAGASDENMEDGG